MKIHFGTGISTVKMAAKFEIISLYSYKSHMLLEHVTRTIKCHKCDETFSRNDKLKIHLLEKHEISHDLTEDLTIWCDKCDQNFVTNDELTKHFA